MLENAHFKQNKKKRREKRNQEEEEAKICDDHLEAQTATVTRRSYTPTL